MKIEKNHKDIYVFFLGLYLVSLPLGIVGLGDFGSLLRLIGLIPLVGWLLFSRRLRFDKILITQVIFILLLLISTSYALNSSISMSRLFTNVLLLTLILVFSSKKINEDQFYKLLKYLVWSSRVTALIVLLFGTYSENRLLLGEVFIEDPNYLTGYFVFGVVSSIFIIMKRMRGNRLLSIAELSIYLFIILSTGSRTGLISYVLIIGVILLSRFSLKSIFYSLITLSSLIIITFILVQFIDTQIIERFTIQSILDSDGTGRFDLWKNALSIFEHSSDFRKIMGYGAGNIKDAYLLYGYTPIVSHNVFIDVLLENGMIGLILYTLLTIFIIIKSYQKDDKRIFYMLLVVLIMSFGSSFYAYKVYWNLILINIIPLSSPTALKVNQT